MLERWLHISLLSFALMVYTFAKAPGSIAQEEPTPPTAIQTIPAQEAAPSSPPSPLPPAPDDNTATTGNPQETAKEKGTATSHTYSKEELLGILPEDLVIGDVKAPVTIIEYASLSCSHCASFHNTVYPKLREQYIDTGKAKFIFRNFPLNEPALHAALLVQCTPDTQQAEKFIKVIFRTQNSWITQKNYIEILSNIGKLGGLPGEKFESCLQDKALQDKLLQSRISASEILEIRSTPTFFINGTQHSGGRDYDYFAKVIDALVSSPAPLPTPATDTGTHKESTKTPPSTPIPPAGNTAPGTPVTKETTPLPDKK